MPDNCPLELKLKIRGASSATLPGFFIFGKMLYTKIAQLH